MLPKFIPYPPVRLKNYIFDERKVVISDVIINDCYGLNQLDKIETVVDVGAHIGIFTNYVKKLFPNCQVMAYEPLKLNYDRLVSNTKELSGVKIFDAAMVSNSGEKYLYMCPNDTTGGIIDQYGTILVKTLTLAHVFEYFEHIDLLKLDCEGSELEILEYAKDHNLLKKIKNITGEYHFGKGPELAKLLSGTHDVWHRGIDGLNSFTSQQGLFRATLK
jgi:FkbM family methyltransferase